MTGPTIPTQQKTIVFIGAGNVATHLSLALQAKGNFIIGVYSKTLQSAQPLATRIGCQAYTSINDIPSAGIYIICVKDQVISEVISQLKEKHPNSTLLHTAGSIPLSVFEKHSGGFGIIYPLQTFSKSRAINWETIPFLIEYDSEETKYVIELLLGSLSSRIIEASSEQRKWVHLSAVFACNFSNHCYNLAMKLLEKQNLPPEILIPLIDETTQKIHELSPHSAQTGPAHRGDKNIMEAHQMMLKDENDLLSIYKLMSESIFNNRPKNL